MRLHHFAYVTDNVEKKASSFCHMFGFKQVGGPLVDRNQGVRIMLLDVGNGLLMELLEPEGTHSPVKGQLDKGEGIYHFCFEVEDLDQELERIGREKIGIVVKSAVEAPAFEGRRVAFVVTSDMDLVEYLEMEKK